MKRIIGIVLVLAMLLSATACSLFDGGEKENENDSNIVNDSGDTSNDTQSAIKLSDSFTHEDPTDIEFEKRYVLYSAHNTEALKYYKEELDVDVVEEFFVLYGDKDDVAVRSYNYYVCATEEDAVKMKETVGESTEGAVTVEGDVVSYVVEKDELNDALEVYVAMSILDDTSASGYAKANKEQFSELVDYVE